MCCVTRGSLFPNPRTVLPFLDSLARCVLGGGRHLLCRGLPVFFSFRATYKQLVHIHPMGKFLAIKTIVFFSWWQVCLHATSSVACPCGGIALCAMWLCCPVQSDRPPFVGRLMCFFSFFWPPVDAKVWASSGHSCWPFDFLERPSYLKLAWCGPFAWCGPLVTRTMPSCLDSFLVLVHPSPH